MKKARRVVELSDDGRLLIDGYTVAVVDLKRNNLSVARFWCEHVRLKLRVGETFGSCKTVKEEE